MKNTILALCLVALVFGAAGMSLAGSNDKWTVYLKAADGSGSNGIVTQCQFGTLTTATDSPAELSVPANDAVNPAGNGSKVVLACFDLGAGSYNNGFYKDQRAPITTGQKVWNLRLWVQSDWTFGDVVLTGWNPSNTYALNGSFPVVLKVVDDPTGTYVAGSTLGTWTGPTYMPTATFTNVGVIKGNGSSYVSLQLIAGSASAATPEPGTLAAMLSMIGGLSGVTIWRKRRS